MTVFAPGRRLCEGRRMTNPIGNDLKTRVLRRDALMNRKRLINGALVAMARDGVRVPVAAIAAEAGVGFGTFYRSFVDRDALMRELQVVAVVLAGQVDVLQQGSGFVEPLRRAAQAAR